MKITLEQYQKLYFLPTGLTSTQYSAEVCKIFNLDTDKPLTEIKNKIDSLKLPKPGNNIQRKKYKIKGKRYMVIRDIMRMEFSEWLEFEGLLSSNTEEPFIIKNLHKTLGIFLRPVRRSWFVLKPKKFSKINYEKNCEDMLSLNVDDALEISLFFYHREQSFIKNIKKYYLNLQIRRSQVEYIKNKLIE